MNKDGIYTDRRDVFAKCVEQVKYLRTQPTGAGTAVALAELFEQHLQQPEKAAEYYQQGLKLSLSTGS